MLRTLLTCCLLALCTAPAWAQDPPADPSRVRAMELYNNGAALYEEGLYEEAIVAFSASYALSQEPDLLYNIANAQERVGQWQEALDTLNRYRALARAEERERLDRRIRNLERRLAAQASPVPAPPPPLTAADKPAPPGPPTPDRARRRPTAVHGIVAASGGVLLAGGVAASAATFHQSRSWKRDGDSERWSRARPLNNAGVACAIVGGGLITTALLLPGKPVEIAARPRGLDLRGRF